MWKRISLIVIGVVAVCAFGFRAPNAGAKDSDYPTRPITFYIAFAAGGNTDIATRALVHAAGKYLGQPFIPINRPGAGGALAASEVMNAKPDGYTLGTNSASSVLLIPHTEESPYKDLSGFTLVMNYGKYIFPLMVRGDAPWKNWNELIQAARQKPGSISVGITGARINSPMGIALWTCEQKENVEFTYIALKGSPEVLNYTLGGHIDVFASSIDPAVLQYLQDGKLRILGYLSDVKTPGFENAPTFKELYGEVPPNLGGVWGPKGIPEDVLKKLDDAFAKAVVDPEFVKIMDSMLMPVVYMNREEINKLAQEEFPKVGEVMEELKTEQEKEKK
jgi:tripartite-type tricarboxylate transporter receptor subunit TctC